MMRDKTSRSASDKQMKRTRAAIARHSKPKRLSVVFFWIIHIRIKKWHPKTIICMTYQQLNPHAQTALRVFCTCALLSIGASVGLLESGSPAREQEESGSVFALLRNISPARTDELLTRFQLLRSRCLASWCLQVYKPGQWHSAPRAAIYSAPEFYEWNGPNHSARGERLHRTRRENPAFWAHSRASLLNPYWTEMSTETEVTVAKPRAVSR